MQVGERVLLSYDLVLFDADGTLWDYDAGERTALIGALNRAGLPFDDDVIARYRAINAELWRLIEGAGQHGVHQGRAVPQVPLGAWIDARRGGGRLGLPEPSGSSGHSRRWCGRTHRRAVGPCEDGHSHQRHQRSAAFPLCAFGLCRLHSGAHNLRGGRSRQARSRHIRPRDGDNGLRRQA